MKQIFIILSLMLFTLGVYAQNGADLDDTFGNEGVVFTPIGSQPALGYKMAVQQDGKIILAGRMNLNGSKMGLVRYNSDGSLDESFGNNGIATISAGQSNFSFSVTIQPDGKIVQGGYIFNGSTYSAVAVRYLENGEIDTSFGNNGVAHLPALNICESIDIQSNGKIVLAGYINDNFGLGRLNSDGSLDVNYGDNGYVKTEYYDEYGTYATSYISQIRVQNDDKIVAVGFHTSPSYSDILIVRYNANGQIDTGFGNSGMISSNLGGLADFGMAVAFQEDGKIIIGAHKENGYIPGTPTYDAAVFRLNSADGSYDNTFGTNGVVLIHLSDEATYVNGVDVLPDGKIIVSGQHVLYSDAKYSTYATRLNDDGSLDTTFGENGSRVYAFSSVEDSPQDVLALADGKILISGHSVGQSGGYEFYVARLKGDITPSLDMPAVDVTFDNITTTTLDVNFTPNEFCESYHFVIMTEDEMQMWKVMMGSPENAIKTFGIHKDESYTHYYTDLAPNTEYYVYTISVGFDAFEAPYDSAYVKTATQGGSGAATATIELKEITDTSVRMIVTPNSETSVFYDGLITKEYFDEIGEDAAIEIIKSNGYPQYAIDDWVWLDLEVNTIYKAIAICQNGIGEWGSPTIQEFSTLPGNSINDYKTTSPIVFPNPGNGIFNIVDDDLIDANIRVINPNGKVVYSTKINEKNTLVDISNCNDGFYIIRIEKNGVVSFAKYIKM